MDFSQSLSDHWLAAMAANDKLMADFEEYILEVCPTLKVNVKEDKLYIKAGTYTIATDYCFVDLLNNVYYVGVELHGEDGQVVEVYHDQLLQELLGLD
jgi:hypothetical protein